MTAAFLAMLVGCAPAGGPDAPTPAPPLTPPPSLSAQFTQDATSWRMPLDSYDGGLGRRLQVAYDWAVRACLVEAGFVQAPDPGSTLSLATATRNEAGVAIFNASTVAKWGYLHAPEPDAAAQASFRTAVDAVARTDPHTVDRCTAQADKATARPDPNILSPQTLTNTAYLEAFSAPAVIAAQQRWHECMAPQGIPDLPENPWDMPSTWLRSRIDMVVVDQPLDPDATPTVQNVQVAQADLACRESTGFTRELYQAEWDLQLGLLAGNIEAMQAYDNATRTWVTTLDSVIARSRG